MSGYVGADHEFHDAEFVRGWANRFIPTESRIQLFDMILEEIAQPSVPNTHVVELGIGPGYMARHILERNEKISYEGVDFSEVFFEIAKETVGDLMHRVSQAGSTGVGSAGAGSAGSGSKNDMRDVSPGEANYIGLREWLAESRRS